MLTPATKKKNAEILLVHPQQGNTHTGARIFLIGGFRSWEASRCTGEVPFHTSVCILIHASGGLDAFRNAIQEYLLSCISVFSSKIGDVEYDGCKGNKGLYDFAEGGVSEGTRPCTKPAVTLSDELPVSPFPRR